jgi:hypothetical protein
MKQKKLTDKQQLALELLTCGKGLSYKAICEEVGIDVRTLWRWRNESDFAHFQEELKRINDERWAALVDAARASAFRLVENDNQKMTEFILKNEGYNPTNNHKVDADINTDINITIGGTDD